MPIPFLLLPPYPPPLAPSPLPRISPVASRPLLLSLCDPSQCSFLPHPDFSCMKGEEGSRHLAVAEDGRSFALSCRHPVADGVSTAALSVFCLLTFFSKRFNTSPISTRRLRSLFRELRLEGGQRSRPTVAHSHLLALLYSMYAYTEGCLHWREGRVYDSSARHTVSDIFMR